MFTQKDNGDEIKIAEFPNYTDQFDFLRKICRNALESKEKTAILFRNNESVIPLIDTLDRYAIDYHIRDNDCLYFSNPAVCDMLSMLTYCENPENKELFVLLAPKLGCGITRKIALEICETSDANGTSVYYEFKKYIYSSTDKGEAARTLFYEIEHFGQRSLSQSITDLHTLTCFGRFLDHRFKDKLKIAILAKTAKGCECLDGFKKRLEYLKDIISCGRSPDVPCVYLSTIHSSKGLEYDNVYIIDVKDGTLPGEPQSHSEQKNEKAFLEEERRLFYVAVTRAKSKAVILKYISEYNGTRANGSKFIRELMNERISIYDIRESPVNKKRSLGNSADYSVYAKGTTVTHSTFGKGRILENRDGICKILFDDKKIRSVSLDICINSGIIKIQKD